MARAIEQERVEDRNRDRFYKILRGNVTSDNWRRMVFIHEETG